VKSLLHELFAHQANLIQLWVPANSAHARARAIAAVMAARLTRWVQIELASVARRSKAKNTADPYLTGVEVGREPH
jgi:hypothetical protein